jgi:hypothetical protein
MGTSFSLLVLTVKNFLFAFDGQRLALDDLDCFSVVIFLTHSPPVERSGVRAFIDEIPAI